MLGYDVALNEPATPRSALEIHRIGAGASRIVELMSTYRLKNVLSPRSVALVGASPRQGSVGRAILANIQKAKFAGEFGLVNPRYSEIDGISTVASLGKLPFVPELVVPTAPAKAIAAIIDAAGKLVVPGVVELH